MALKGGSQGKWDRRQEVWTLLSLPLLVYSLLISWLKKTCMDCINRAC